MNMFITFLLHGLELVIGCAILLLSVICSIIYGMYSILLKGLLKVSNIQMKIRNKLYGF